MAQLVLFETLIQDVIRRIGQVSGTSVQTYSEDLIGDMIQHKFDVLFEEVWWTRFMRRRTETLDGVTGVVDISLFQPPNGLKNRLARFEDIHSVFPSGSQHQLSRVPTFFNPVGMQGTTPRYIEIDSSIQRIFHVYPLTSIGDVDIVYRSLPTPFVAGDEVQFDDQALILGAAFDYLSDDGTNPSATDDMKDMFESRVRQLKKSQAWLPHDLDPRTHDTVDDWHVA